MQNRGQRYLGMTITQLIVLACLGLTAIGLLWFTAKLFLGSSPELGMLLVQPTQENQATSILLSTLTPIPSSTPILPTPTFTATTYASLIPEGWQQIKYAKVEFWMPADFEKDSSSTNLIGLTNKKAGTNGIRANVSLSNESGIKTDLNSSIQDGVSKFTHDITFLEKRAFSIGPYEAARLKMEVIVLNIPLEEAVYFIKDGDTVWTISSYSHLEDFQIWLPVFEKIARTFRITD